MRQIMIQQNGKQYGSGLVWRKPGSNNALGNAYERNRGGRLVYRLQGWFVDGSTSPFVPYRDPLRHPFHRDGHLFRLLYSVHALGSAAAAAVPVSITPHRAVIIITVIITVYVLCIGPIAQTLALPQAAVAAHSPQRCAQGVEEAVKGLQRAQAQREPLPAAQHQRQARPAATPLHNTDDHHGHGHSADQAERGDEDNVAGKGQGQEAAREDEEHHQEVEDGKPPVAGGGATKEAGDAQRNAAQDGNREEEEDAGDVEEEVAQCQLQSEVDGAGGRGQRRQDARGRCAHVGAQRQRVHAFQLQAPHAHQRRKRGGEDGRALHQDGHAGTDHQGEVVGQAGEGAGEVGVDGLLGHARHLWAQHGVQQLHHQVQASREEEEGEDEEEDAGGGVTQTQHRQQGLACKHTIASRQDSISLPMLHSFSIKKY